MLRTARQLDYAPRVRRSSRWIIRAATILVVLGAAVLAARKWGPGIRGYLRSVSLWKAAQQQCLQFMPAPGQVIFDESAPREPVGLPEKGAYRVSRWRVDRRGPVLDAAAAMAAQGDLMSWGSAPACWVQLRRAHEQFTGSYTFAFGARPALTYDPEDGTGFCAGDVMKPQPQQIRQSPSDHDRARFFCFMHGRRAFSERLVIVGFDGGGFIWGDPNPFWACVMKTGIPSKSDWPFPPFTKIAGFTFKVDSDKTLRIYAGQPDATDASHFTIAYQAGEKKGIIDGWLKEDDTVELKLR